MSPKPLPTILVAHNRYQQKGGEDSVVESEVAMLRAHGHEVVEYVRSNDELKGRSLPAAALSALWSSESARQLKQLIAQSGADIVHVHNTFPVMSPSVYWAAAQAGVPVVQTLHNFRLACPQAMFLREGKVCEQCIGTVPWRAVVHRCYRDSAAQSAVSMATITLHRALGTYTHKVNRFIALNGFCQSKFVEMGLPAHKIAIKPNFVKPMADPAWDGRDGGVFVGRLSGEKGITTLLAALKQAPGVAVQVVGGGEHEAAVRAQLGSGYLGFQPLDEVIALMRRSAYLVLPSIWYENLPSWSRTAKPVCSSSPVMRPTWPRSCNGRRRTLSRCWPWAAGPMPSSTASTALSATMHCCRAFTLIACARPARGEQGAGSVAGGATGWPPRAWV